MFDLVAVRPELSALNSPIAVSFVIEICTEVVLCTSKVVVYSNLE